VFGKSATNQDKNIFAPSPILSCSMQHQHFISSKEKSQAYYSMTFAFQLQAESKRQKRLCPL